MITVQEALELIAQNKSELGTESVPFQLAMGRILAQTIKTDRPIPPYHRVTMDGIAVNYDGLTSKEKISIEGIAAAGAPQMTIQDKSSCLEVMTGAVLPAGTDTVIRYEDLTIESGFASINVNITKNQNVHFEGSDMPADLDLIHPGTRIRTQELAIAASLGRAELNMAVLPSVTIISTGDELVDVQEKPETHQIRKSNSYTVAALLANWGIKAEFLHLADNKKTIEEKLATIIAKDDLVILSGGVSKGKFDFIPEALRTLGIKEVFHKVRQRPGKPLWFGRNEETVVFGLPGNPVSSFVCAKKYIEHWLRSSLGVKKEQAPYAILSEDVTFKPDLHYFLPVALTTNESAQIMAQPFPGNGSGDFINLRQTNGLIELPRGRDLFKKGECFPYLKT